MGMEKKEYNILIKIQILDMLEHLWREFFVLRGERTNKQKQYTEAGAEFASVLS